jgi:hypothetical protein
MRVTSDPWGWRERRLGAVLFVILAVLLGLLILARPGHAAPATGPEPAHGGPVNDSPSHVPLVLEQAFVTNCDAYPDGVRYYVAVKTARGHVAGAIINRRCWIGQWVIMAGRLSGREILRPVVW